MGYAIKNHTLIHTFAPQIHRSHTNIIFLYEQNQIFSSKGIILPPAGQEHEGILSFRCFWLRRAHVRQNATLLVRRSVQTIATNHVRRRHHRLQSCRPSGSSHENLGAGKRRHTLHPLVPSAQRLDGRKT